MSCLPASAATRRSWGAGLIQAMAYRFQSNRGWSSMMVKSHRDEGPAAGNQAVDAANNIRISPTVECSRLEQALLGPPPLTDDDPKQWPHAKRYLEAAVMLSRLGADQCLRCGVDLRSEWQQRYCAAHLP